ncbi:MAG: VOC family protein, partial [Kordiimonadaceae bacterium]|nr:VOC family protein [Kordiimonadaceae bacterium]
MTLIRMISLVCFLVVFGNKAVAQDTPDIIGNNVNLYYHNYDEAEHFYSYILGFKSVHEINGYSKTFQISPTTFITLIHDDGTGRARHSADEPKTVAIALLTDHVQEWYDYAVEQKLKIRAPLKPLGDKNYQSFFVTDPGGYYLEFEYLADHPENTVLFPLLEKSEHIYPDKEQETS